MCDTQLVESKCDTQLVESKSDTQLVESKCDTQLVESKVKLIFTLTVLISDHLIYRCDRDQEDVNAPT